MSLHIRIVSTLFASLLRKGHKMFGGYLRFNKGVIAANIAITHGASNDFRKLIDCLSVEELKILKQDEDLIQQVENVLELDAEGLREHMVKTWGLLVEECQDNDWWFDIEEVRKRCPKWSRAVIEGHYVEGGNFVTWARQWLMQEIRVNINIKYIKELRDAVKEKKEKERRELEKEHSAAVKYGVCDNMGYI
ncbi:hypothetical protein LCGC14_1828240 [marine sediment metagenome]|uniref:Uncharacterized protein n=1 Tax=marine sediment metagenome TaxID=412755 RepID=A0A0F9JGD2_9ZZZZ